jgi:hypothetical protein
VQGLSVQASAATEVPQVKNAVSLYVNITGIRWDYEAPDNRIAGYVSRKGGDVSEFAIEEGLEECQATQELWKLIGDSIAA